MASLLSRLASALKSRIAFPAYGGQGLQRSGIYDWFTWTGGQAFDFREAAGDLHSNGVVMACASWIMRAFPEPPVQVIKQEAGTGEENAVPDHPLTLAFRRPNPYYGADCLWQRVIFDRSLHGQAYLYKQRNAAGDVIELYHVPQQRLTPQWDTSGREFVSYYLFTLEQRQERIETQDLVHFRFGGDPHRERLGLPTLGAGLREVATLNEAANYRAALLRNMGVPSHLVQGKDPQRPITAEQARMLHALWSERVSGGNRGKPIIANWPLEAIKVGMSPAELDLGDMDYEATSVICSLFGVSPQVLGLTAGDDAKTYANYREAREGTTETALIPAWKQIAQDLTLHLLPDYSTDAAERVEFDLSKVRALQEDQTELWSRIDQAIKTGWLQINEGRALVDLPPVEGGDVMLPSQGQPVDLTPSALAAVGQAVGGRTGAPEEKPTAEPATNGNGRRP